MFKISIIIAALLLAQTCFAANVILQWDAETDPSVTGYKVYYQADSAIQPFQNTLDVGNVTTATINGLDGSHIYYFAVTAYDAAGNESDYSTIISTLDMINGTIKVRLGRVGIRANSKVGGIRVR